MRNVNGEIFVGETRGALEAAAKFAETLGSAGVALLVMNLFELRGKFGGAPIVAGTEDEIEKFFQRRGVTRRAAQNRFEQADGFLRQAVAGEEVYVGKRLSDELLRVVVERRFGGDRCFGYRSSSGWSGGSRSIKRSTRSQPKGSMSPPSHDDCM